MDRTLESIEALNEQLTSRYEDVEADKAALIAENGTLTERVESLEADNKELRRQLVSMRAA